MIKKSHLFIVLSLILLVNACGINVDINSQTNGKSTQTTFTSDVIGVREQYLAPEYWLKKLPTQSNVLMTTTQIAKQNIDIINNNPYVTDPLTYVELLSKIRLTQLINRISKIPTSERFYADGDKVSQHKFKQYLASANIQGVAQHNQVEFALVVKRSPLRTFPTFDKVYAKDSDGDLDRFQESGVFPGDAVAILHTSKDSKWILVQAYNYLAWMQKSDVAIGDKSIIAAYKNYNDYLVTTGSKIFTNYVPNHPQISNLQIDMGTRLPLAKRNEYGNKVYGQNPYANYVVKLPIRTVAGKLKIVLALIPRSQDVHRGYLPFTQQNIIKQAFKFLGERYGWGHDYNGRDCTGFVGEVYKSFGFKIPRNSGAQGISAYGINHRFDKNKNTINKMAAINKMQAGDLAYIPSHVMIVLGKEQGKPFIIHDVHGLSYLQKNGDLYRGVLNGVSVTPLLPLKLSKSTNYTDSIYNIKRITSIYKE